MKHQDSFRIGPGLRGKLRDVVRVVDSLTLSSRSARIESAHQSMPPPPASVFRICTFSGGWDKGTQKTVTFKYMTNSPNTVSAMNLFADIGTVTQNLRNCAIAKDGTAWFLISAEC